MNWWQNGLVGDQIERLPPRRSKQNELLPPTRIELLLYGDQMIKMIMNIMNVGRQGLNDDRNFGRNGGDQNERLLLPPRIEWLAIQMMFGIQIRLVGAQNEPLAFSRQ